MKKLVEKAKENPWWIALTVLGIGGGGSIAKFGLFDQIMPVMHSIVYNQRIIIHIKDTKDLHKAEDAAEDDMIDLGFWKKRGAE